MRAEERRERRRRGTTGDRRYLAVSDLRKEYDEQGYVIARGALDPDLAQETVDHVHWLCERYPDVRPERFGHNLLVDDPFIHRLVGDDRLLDLAEQFISPRCRALRRALHRQEAARREGPFSGIRTEATGRSNRWMSPPCGWPARNRRSETAACACCRGRTATICSSTAS